MAIKTITVHRVEVEVPWRTWILFGESREYERMMIEATVLSEKSGNDRYGKIVEYAEFDNLASAQAAEAKMVNVVRYFEQKQIEYDKEIESE